MLIVEDGIKTLSNDVAVLGLQVDSFGSIMILWCDRNFKVVIVLSGINCKARLIGLERDTKSYFGTEHHDRAVHVVVHDILKSRLEGFFVNQEEVDELISTNLNSNVASNEIDLTSHVFHLFEHLPIPWF